MKCPHCGYEGYETWEEQEYENQDDQTPEYGGKLILVKYEDCGNCGCSAVN